MQRIHRLGALSWKAIITLVLTLFLIGFILAGPLYGAYKSSREGIEKIEEPLKKDPIKEEPLKEGEIPSVSFPPTYKKGELVWFIFAQDYVEGTIVSSKWNTPLKQYEYSIKATASTNPQYVGDDWNTAETVIEGKGPYPRP